MVDISQWRASIGLWYYQICDNVKSLTALCRKGTRAKEQSSNEKQFSHIACTSQIPVPCCSSTTVNADGCAETVSLAVLLFFLLISSEDIELNPGPKTGNI